MPKTNIIFKIMRAKRFVKIYAVMAIAALLFVFIIPLIAGATTISTSISTGGNLTVTGDATISGNTTLTGFTQHSAGTVSLPSISFVNDANTGIYNPSASGEFAVTIDGTQRLTIGSSTQNVAITGSTSVSGVAIYAAGSVSAPSIAFSGDTDTGLFASAANTLQLVAGGYNPIQIGTSSSTLNNVTINGTTTAGNILANNSLVGNSAFSFGDDSDTGIFHGAANTIHLMAGGKGALTIGSSSNDLVGVTINGSTTVSGKILANGGAVGNPGFSFSDDSDTGIYLSSTNNIMQLVAGGNGPLTIGSSSSDLVGVTINGSTSITGNLKSGTVATNGSTTLDIAGALTVIALCHGNADTDDEPIVDCSGAPSDIAEYYETTNDVETGDVVATTQNFITYKSVRLEGAGTVVPGKNETLSVLAKSSTPYQSNIIGIVSTAPYQLFGEDVKEASKHPMPIALAGRVPVKVTNENGAIRAGDWLAASSKPGYAMKATGAGYVIGIALANLDNQSGKILALVKPGYIGASQFQGGEGLSIQSTSGAANLEKVEKLTVQKNATIQGRLIVKGNARFDGQIIVGKDTAGMVSLKTGQKTARVDFGIAYKKMPVVTVAPLGNPGGYYWVSDVSEKGFAVNISKAPSSDLGFNWIALGSNAGLGEEE